MAITYTRSITNIVTKDMVVNGVALSNCITSVSWDYTGTNEDGVSGTFSGTMSWDRNPDRPDKYVSVDGHTPLENVTEADVWSWIDARTPDNYLQHQKDVVQAEINRNMPSTQMEAGTLPWE